MSLTLKHLRISPGDRLALVITLRKWLSNSPTRCVFHPYQQNYQVTLRVSHQPRKCDAVAYYRSIVRHTFQLRGVYGEHWPIVHPSQLKCGVLHYGS